MLHHYDAEEVQSAAAQLLSRGRPDDRGFRDALEDGYGIRALGKKENALALKDAGDAQQPSPAQLLCWWTSTAEQRNEDGQKNWCDLELRTRMHRSRTSLQAADLDAKIDEEKAAVQELSEEFEEADQMVVDLVTH